MHYSANNSDTKAFEKVRILARAEPTAGEPEARNGKG